MSDSKCVFVGRVVTVEKTETLGKNPDKPFRKRVIVVDDAEDGAKYPNPVPFEATGDKCDFLDKYKAGDVVRIEFYPNGRAWNDPKTGKTRYFSSNRIGFIKVDDGDGGDADGADGGQADAVDGDVDDMPF